MNTDVNKLLHDADRKVMGANFAREMGHHGPAAEMDRDARELYQRAMQADPERADDAWAEDGNRDHQWLRKNRIDLGVPPPAGTET